MHYNELLFNPAFASVSAAFSPITFSQHSNASFLARPGFTSANSDIISYVPSRESLHEENTSLYAPFFL